MITLHDADGNAITPPNCDCGKPSSTWIQGVSTSKWYCYECLYGKYEEVRFVFKDGIKSAHINELVTDSWTVKLYPYDNGNDNNSSC